MDINTIFWAISENILSRSAKNQRLNVEWKICHSNINQTCRLSKHNILSISTGIVRFLRYCKCDGVDIKCDGADKLWRRGHTRVDIVCILYYFYILQYVPLAQTGDQYYLAYNI